MRAYGRDQGLRNNMCSLLISIDSLGLRFHCSSSRGQHRKEARSDGRRVISANNWQFDLFRTTVWYQMETEVDVDQCEDVKMFLNLSRSLSFHIISRSVCQVTCHQTSGEANQREILIDKPRPKRVCYSIHLQTISRISYLHQIPSKATIITYAGTISRSSLSLSLYIYTHVYPSSLTNYEIRCHLVDWLIDDGRCCCCLRAERGLRERERV